jgi:nucleotide-binding universal stress UspA family protein
MTIQRVLVAVDDSPAALRAARFATDLAAGWHAHLRLVAVAADHALGSLLDTTVPEGRAAERVERAGHALLQHLAHAARVEGIEVDSVLLGGEPFRQILEQAHAWNADLIVMGRSDRHGPSSPYLGSVTAHVLEFADCPVLVIPRTPSPDHDVE